MIKKHGKQIVEGQESTHYESPRKKRGQKKDQLQPPMTPMIDVTFQLLIFFLVTSQYLAPEGQLPGTVPKIKIKAITQPTTDPTQTIKVLPMGDFGNQASYKIIETDMTYHDPEALYEALEEYKTTVGGDWKKHVTITIDPAYNACWGFAVDAYNQAVRAGYENIGLAPVK